MCIFQRPYSTSNHPLLSSHLLRRPKRQQTDPDDYYANSISSSGDFVDPSYVDYDQEDSGDDGDYDYDGSGEGELYTDEDEQVRIYST